MLGALRTGAAALLGNPLPLLLGGVHRLWIGLGLVASKVNAQGWVGLAAGLFLWVHFGGEARHWHKQSNRFETLFRQEKNAFGLTVSNYMHAQAQADAAAKANVVRVDAEGTTIKQDRGQSYETRIADARARAERMWGPGSRGADQGGAVAAGLPVIPGTAGVGVAAVQDGFPHDDRLLCTSYAIELDEVLKTWRSLAAVKTSPEPSK